MEDFITLKEEKESQFEKPKYLKLLPYVPVRVRVLDKMPYMAYKHYIPSASISVLCLGEECPICQRNTELIKNNPGVKYMNIKGLIPRQERYLVNVLNRTPVKVTSAGSIVYPNLEGEFPTSAESESLVGIEAKPLNQVEVLERGYELFSNLQILHKTTRNAANELVGLTNFDIVLIYPGGKKSPQANATAFMDEVNVPPESMYTLSAMGIQLTSAEMLKALSGVRLKDIFAARRESDTISDAEKTLEDASADVKSSVADIFATSYDEE